ncbi:MAG: TIGR00730 family Rossman fold protein [Bacteroidaceae bacterium]|nr:TIGR00730 family Rossman fold protein [Bacteroidaceae bacterium]
MKIAVYCASSTKISPIYFQVAQELGRLMAEQGIGLINGAGNMGLMCATSDACLAAGGEVTGVIPTFMVEQGWHHKGLTRIIETPDMHTRKATIAELNDGCIALPGGCGTLEELMEVITWKQLGLYLKPIVILNIDGYYDHLLAQLEHGIEEHFMGERHREIWRVATTAREAIDLVLSTPLWDASVRKFAAI